MNLKTITDRVLDALQRNPACEFDLLVKDCSEYTWNQLFYEVDRLSRTGQVCLVAVGNGRYSLKLAKGEEPPQGEFSMVTDSVSQPVASAGAGEPGRDHDPVWYGVHGIKGIDPGEVQKS